MKKIETRAFDITMNHDDEMVLKGLIPYEKQSLNMGFFEILKRGCFKKTVAESRDLHFLEEHDPAKLRARGKNGSLKVTEDNEGVHFEVHLVDTQENRDLYTKVRSGLLDNVSFGFQIIKDRWDASRTHREVIEARLYEISAVGSPAYEATTLSCRSLSQVMEGAEILTEENIAEIKAELEKLQNLLPKEEPTNNNEQPQQEVQEEPEADDIKEPEITSEVESEAEPEQKEEPVPQVQEETVPKADYDSLLEEYNKVVEDFTEQVNALKERI